MLFAPDAEFIVPQEMLTLGLDPSYRGHAGRVEAVGKWLEAWGTSDLEPAYMLDRGDRLLLLGF